MGKRVRIARERSVAATFLPCALSVCFFWNSPARANASDSSPAIACRDVFVPAALGPGLPRQYSVYGELCAPAQRPPSVLQVLVHGATYSHTYWNFPGFQGRYSYSQYMSRAGYATIAIDMLGVGRSSHPPSAAVSINAEAHVVHEVIQAARAGALGGSYDKVVVVSHSIGTLTAFVEAATYQDADALLATGGSHSLGVLGFGRILATVRPALLDPVTRDQVPPLDFGYLSAPGARAVFYQSGDAEPALVAADESTRSPVPLSLAATLIEYAALTPLIRAPVLLANGELDVAFCLQGGGGSVTNCADAATLYQAEAAFFGASAKFETYVLPNNGHNINLVRDAPIWYAQALKWFQRTAPVR